MEKITPDIKKFVEDLSALGEDYDKRLGKLTEGRAGAVAAVSQHLADVVEVLSNKAFSLRNQLEPDIEGAVEARAASSQELQDAFMHLGHVMNVLGSVQTHANHAGLLLEKAAGLKN